MDESDSDRLLSEDEESQSNNNASDHGLISFDNTISVDDDATSEGEAEEELAQQQIKMEDLDKAEQKQSDGIEKEEAVDEKCDGEDEDDDADDDEDDSESYSSSSTEESSGEFGEESEVIQMPLLKYCRIADSLRAQAPPQPQPTTSEETAAPAPSTTAALPRPRPRPLSIRCRCSTLGQTIIRPPKHVESALGGLAGLSSLNDATTDLLQRQLSNTSRGRGLGGTNATGASSTAAAAAGAGPEKVIVSRAKKYSILAMAMEDGSIHVIDAQTGVDVCPPTELKVYANQGSGSGSGSSLLTRKAPPPDIVALSFDSGANYLGALTSNGDVAVFELKYGLRKIGVTQLQSSSRTTSETTAASATTSAGGQERTSTSTTTSAAASANRLFDSFLSRLAGDDKTTTTTTSSSTAPLTAGTRTDDATNTNPNDSTSTSTPSNSSSSHRSTIALCLTQPVSIARFSYGKQSNPDTKASCLVIDPSYHRKREKEILVGFTNGRLVLTKRSGFGGTTVDDNGFGGVMGSLLQPKRNDVDLYQSGAGGDGIECIAWRGPTVAWADNNGIKIFDIEKMNRIAHIDKPSGARATLYPHISSLSPRLIFEKSNSLLVCWGDCLMNLTINGNKVKCTMAWELDCVGCDVQPIDLDYVVLLGLSSAPNKEEDQNGNDDNNDADDEDDLATNHVVELQIIKRLDGSVTASDVLPLAVPPASSSDDKNKPSTADFALSSSFATPRMADNIEAEGEEGDDEATGVDIQNIIMDTMASSINEKRPEKKFTDQYLKWSIDSYRKAVIDDCGEGILDDESSDSVESDDSEDYGFLFREDSGFTCPTEMLTNPPTMIVRSKDDVVLTQIRDVDDFIDSAQKSKCFGLALRRGLRYRQMLRRHALDDLVDDYLTAILNPSESVAEDDYESPRSLSIRRLKLAAKSMPILIGSKIHQWAKWSKEFSRIPGGLLLLRPYLPVRDPKLPAIIYETFLCDMFSEIEEMLLNSDEDDGSTSSSIHENAVDLFLAGLRAWGAMSAIRDRMKLYRRAVSQKIGTKEQWRLFHEAETAFSARMNQSAANYLVIGSDNNSSELVNPSSVMLPSGVTHDSLFDVKAMETIFEDKLSKLNDNLKAKSFILEIIAELYMMEGDFSQCLKTYVALGAHNSSDQLTSVEVMAMKSVFREDSKYVESAIHNRYKHVLTLVETNELHKVLLSPSAEGAVAPLVALICLIGLQDAGRYIVDHCVLPESDSASEGSSIMSLPLDRVAKQLEDHPKLLLWFLHSIIASKPEIYVKFPNTAVPSPAVTRLHQIHFDLYVKFSDRTKKVNRELSDIPSFDEIHKESALLRFLKAALPHGGIRSDDVRYTLESFRSGMDQPATKKEVGLAKKVEYPHLFAHELAFVIERSGTGTKDLSNQVLTLYLEGVVSLPLAVEYAERNARHSSMLWDNLISYCLAKEINGRRSDGKIFGSLLEVAARSGADLALLVSKIPKKLSIDGIRPRLSAAISDYQIKVQMHKAAFEVLSSDKVSLLREQYHRSRRGTRVDLYGINQEILQEEKFESDIQNRAELKPLKEGKDRLASKRKERRAQTSKMCNVGIDLPRSLQII